jgi:hypothetical protein
MVCTLILEKKLWKLVAHLLLDILRLPNASLYRHSCPAARRKSDEAATSHHMPSYYADGIRIIADIVDIGPVYLA